MIDKNSDASINAGFGSRNQTSEAALDVEREPMPDQTPDTNSNHPKIPPAGSGSVSEAREDPTEGDPIDNPTHHTGHLPPPVTANPD